MKIRFIEKIKSKRRKKLMKRIYDARLALKEVSPSGPDSVNFMLMLKREIKACKKQLGWSE